MSKTYTADEIVEALRTWCGVDDSPEAAEWLSATLRRMNGWIGRGDGIAVYTNEDLGHSQLGDKRFVSFGSPAAQLETDTPPAVLPDGIGGGINWRYTLTGTYREGELSCDQGADN